MNTPFDQVRAILEARGQAAYLGEYVSQKEHALQAAYLAVQNGASDSLIVAALLHDFGHLVNESGAEPSASDVDGRHENAGYLWAAQRFGPEVTESIRLHVAAKRYLCFVDPEYRGSLSPASVISLELQGGMFSAPEAFDFESNPFHTQAILVRRWDDLAKTPAAQVPGIEHYRSYVDAAARR